MLELLEKLRTFMAIVAFCKCHGISHNAYEEHGIGADKRLYNAISINCIGGHILHLSFDRRDNLENISAY